MRAPYQHTGSLGIQGRAGIAVGAEGLERGRHPPESAPYSEFQPHHPVAGPLENEVNGSGLPRPMYPQTVTQRMGVEMGSGTWLVAIGPVDGNWANPCSLAVLWASRNASQEMFGIPDLNLVGFPMTPNPADFFHIPGGARWCPFGGEDDNGTLFRVSTTTLSVSGRSSLFVCVNQDISSGPASDLTAIVRCFNRGQLEPSAEVTRIGPDAGVPRGSLPTPAQRRYGFRLWISKLNSSPEIRRLVERGGLFPHPSSLSWYLVSRLNYSTSAANVRSLQIFRGPAEERARRLSIAFERRVMTSSRGRPQPQPHHCQAPPILPGSAIHPTPWQIPRHRPPPPVHRHRAQLAPRPHTEEQPHSPPAGYFSSGGNYFMPDLAENNQPRHALSPPRGPHPPSAPDETDSTRSLRR
mmetsp:Transcript_14386/g.45356  ORF Transcript_14386/g.45356 Transcript_14386/m.45356 type:complete len:410 (-) Transcript_14386:211-1440(-)